MKEKYTVLNYHGFISLPSEDDRKKLFVEAGNFNELEPFEESFTLEQIEYMNYRSNVFKRGRLEFKQEDKAELSEYLNINFDSEDYFSAEFIQDTVKNPTKEKLDRVVSIKDLATIDLFRGLVVSYGNMDIEDVSNRVVKVVNERRKEIYNKNINNTKIKIKKTKSEIEMEAQERAMEKVLVEAKAKAEKDAEEKYSKMIADLEKKLEEASKPKSTRGRKPKAENEDEAK